MEKSVNIYTDGSALGNPGPGGYGAILIYRNHEKRLSGGFQLTTNNRMEIMACIVGLEALKAPCSVLIFTDSRYVVDSVSKGWVYSWLNRGWKKKDGKRAENVDLWQRMLPLLSTHEVEFRWIRGHTGHRMNEACDTMAKEAAQKSNLPVDDGYGGNSPTYSPRAKTSKASSMES